MAMKFVLKRGRKWKWLKMLLENRVTTRPKKRGKMGLDFMLNWGRFCGESRVEMGSKFSEDWTMGNHIPLAFWARFVGRFCCPLVPPVLGTSLPGRIERWDFYFSWNGWNKRIGWKGFNEWNEWNGRIVSSGFCFF